MAWKNTVNGKAYSYDFILESCRDAAGKVKLYTEAMTKQINAPSMDAKALNESGN